MNYNRFLDLHLCTNTDLAVLKQKHPDVGDRRFFSHRGTEYFYDFPEDVKSQEKNRFGKNLGYGNKNSKILENVEVTQSQKSLLQFTGNVISEELKQLRYLGCLVAIENLKGETKHPQLRALMSWISDSSTINKLRVNCHGSGDKDGGFNMGGISLKPEELVAALKRHGLTRDGRAKVQPGGTAHAARWKLNEEVSACEGCNTPFQRNYFRSGKHHCRRCGGIFCERCSARTMDLAVALVGPDKPPAKNVKQARICQKCFDEVQTIRIASLGLQPAGGVVHTSPHLDQYGLQTFTLGLCMGAKSGVGFSEERSREQGLSEAEARFVADSLAGRLVAALRVAELRGIKVTASNQVVGNARDGNQGFKNDLEITYPRPQLYAGPVRMSSAVNEVTIPGFVWGTNQSAEAFWNSLPVSRRPESAEIAVGPTRRDLEFGRTDGQGDFVTSKIATLRHFFERWKFSSWICREDTCFSQTTRRARSAKTLRLTPPPRIHRIEPVLGNVNSPKIRVIGRSGDDMFKWFKSYEVS